MGSSGGGGGGGGGGSSSGGSSSGGGSIIGSLISTGINALGSAISGSSSSGSSSGSGHSVLTQSQQDSISSLQNSYNQKMAAGDTAGAAADHAAANKIREAQGLRAGIDYDADSGASLSTSKGITPTQNINPYDVKYQPIDNSALYQQQAAEKAAAIRQAIARQKTTAEGNISNINNQYGTAVTTAQNYGAQLPDQFTQLNNQASNRGQINAQRIRNAMAQMGLQGSGESASQQLQQNLDTGNQINSNNQQLQKLTTDVNTQVTGLQGEQAAKTAAIRQAIADAEASSNENSALALSDAQAKIAAEASQNAVKANDWNLDIAKLKQDAIDKASKNAWDRSGFDNAVAKSNAEAALKQANELELLAKKSEYEQALEKIRAATKATTSSSGSSSSTRSSSSSSGTSKTVLAQAKIAAQNDQRLWLGEGEPPDGYYTLDQLTQAWYKQLGGGSSSSGTMSDEEMLNAL